MTADVIRGVPEQREEAEADAAEEAAKTREENLPLQGKVQKRSLLLKQKQKAVKPVVQERKAGQSPFLPPKRSAGSLQRRSAMRSITGLKGTAASAAGSFLSGNIRSIISSRFQREVPMIWTISRPAAASATKPRMTAWGMNSSSAFRTSSFIRRS